ARSRVRPSASQHELARDDHVEEVPADEMDRSNTVAPAIERNLRVADRLVVHELETNGARRRVRGEKVVEVCEGEPRATRPAAMLAERGARRPEPLDAASTPRRMGVIAGEEELAVCIDVRMTVEERRQPARPCALRRQENERDDRSSSFLLACCGAQAVFQTDTSA